MKEQLQVAIALLIATGGMDYAVNILEERLDIDMDEAKIQAEFGYDGEKDGQMLLPTAEMKEQVPRKFRGTVEKCKTLNTKVTLDGSIFFVPTVLLNARGLERAIIEMRKTAQEGMKPRWVMLLEGFE